MGGALLREEGLEGAGGAGGGGLVVAFRGLAGRRCVRLRNDMQGALRECREQLKLRRMFIKSASGLGRILFVSL